MAIVIVVFDFHSKLLLYTAREEAQTETPRVSGRWWVGEGGIRTDEAKARAYILINGNYTHRVVNATAEEGKRERRERMLCHPFLAFIHSNVDQI